MAPRDVFRLIKFTLPFILSLLWHKLLAIPTTVLNRLTSRPYTPGPDPKNIVIIGGSWAGTSLAKALTTTLPSGWRAILIEPNSHFNLLFPFPRFAVIPGHEHKAFIPYTAILGRSRAGVFSRRQDAVVHVRKDAVELASGEVVPYAFLAVATGTSSPFPAKLGPGEKSAQCAELRGVQARVRDAERVAVVGGGAVGVELVTDVKSWYPEKSVVLVHSRERLLGGYGARLHERVMERMGELGVEVRLGERPKIGAVGEKGAMPRSLRFKDKEEEVFDLVIPCTGQTPNTSLLREVFPDSISPSTGRILVQPTLQIASTQNAAGNMFALGDVAESGGPKMGRAAIFQAEIVADNIVSMIKRGKTSRVYSPFTAVEGAIKLTLGVSEAAIYAANERGEDALLSIKSGREDAEAPMLWSLIGAKFDEALALQDA